MTIATLIFIFLIVSFIIGIIQIWASIAVYEATKSPALTYAVGGIEGYAIAKAESCLPSNSAPSAPPLPAGHRPAPCEYITVGERARIAAAQADHRTRWSGQALHDREAARNRKRMLGNPNFFSW